MTLVKLFIDEKERALFDMMPQWAIAIDSEKVNIQDLIYAFERPGAIIRCDGNPSELIKVLPTMDSDVLGCVAGWISED